MRSGDKARSTPVQYQWPPKVIPAEIAKMMAHGSCAPSVRTPLSQHVLTPPDGLPDGTQAFIMGIDERLCVLGEFNEQSANPLTLTPLTVEMSDATDHLISVETRMTSIGTVMVIHNYHSRPVRYRAFIRQVGGNIQPTSVCPVRPNIPMLEHWPYPVDILSVGDFQLLEPDADASCK